MSQDETITKGGGCNASWGGHHCEMAPGHPGRHRQPTGRFGEYTMWWDTQDGAQRHRPGVNTIDMRGTPLTPEAMAKIAEDAYGEPTPSLEFKNGVLGLKPRQEFEEAAELAERVLDRPNADPDDDLAVLARQTKRAAELREEVAKWKERAEGAERREMEYGRQIDRLTVELHEALEPQMGFRRRTLDAEADRDKMLAIIHRDGGHYLAKHGVQKAIDDACAVILAAHHSNDAAKGLMADLQVVQRENAELSEKIFHVQTGLADRDFEIVVHKARVQKLEEEQALNERKLIRCTVAMREVVSEMNTACDHDETAMVGPITLGGWVKRLSDARYAKAECGPDCPQCSGKACVRCEHDVIERHTRPKG